jgi:hypothetical protein
MYRRRASSAGFGGWEAQTPQREPVAGAGPIQLGQDGQGVHVRFGQPAHVSVALGYSDAAWQR